MAHVDSVYTIMPNTRRNTTKRNTARRQPQRTQSMSTGLLSGPVQSDDSESSDVVTPLPVHSKRKGILRTSPASSSGCSSMDEPLISPAGGPGGRRPSKQVCINVPVEVELQDPGGASSDLEAGNLVESSDSISGIEFITDHYHYTMAYIIAKPCLHDLDHHALVDCTYRQAWSVLK